VTEEAPNPKRDPSRKPPTLAVVPEGIPPELPQLAQWVRWRWSWDSPRETWTKVPLQPNRNSKASTKNQKTWGSFDAVVSALGKDDVDGLGFVFTAEDPYCGVDLDACRDPESGAISGPALAVLRMLKGYAEVSVTGTGVHVIVRASLGKGRKSSFVEIYDRGRYFIVTGRPVVLPEAPR
jgi:putative DNA primase/helicase